MAFRSSRARGTLPGLLLGVSLTAVVVGPAVQAQVPAPAPAPAPVLTPMPAPAPTVLTSPQEVAACLCLERSVSTLANELGARNRIYREKQQQVEQLEQQVAQKRQTMNVNDPAEVDAFRALLDRRNAAQTEFANQVTPEYAGLVETYNRRVSEFNGRCGNHAYDSTVLASVRANLSCPAQ